MHQTCTFSSQKSLLARLPQPWRHALRGMSCCMTGHHRELSLTVNITTCTSRLWKNAKGVPAV